MNDLEMMKKLFGNDLVVATKHSNGHSKAVMLVAEIDGDGVYQTYEFDKQGTMISRAYFIDSKQIASA